MKLRFHGLKSSFIWCIRVRRPVVSTLPMELSHDTVFLLCPAAAHLFSSAVLPHSLLLSLCARLISAGATFLRPQLENLLFGMNAAILQPTPEQGLQQQPAFVHSHGTWQAWFISAPRAVSR